MDTKYLEKLEFHKICAILKNYAITYIGQNFAINLQPLENKQSIIKALKQTTEASILLYRKGSLPISEIEDITPHIKKLESTTSLTMKQLLDVANILRIASQLRDYFFSTDIEMASFTYLHGLFSNLYINPSIQKTISSVILDENTIADDATEQLQTIRKKLHHKEQEIRTKLNSYLHSKYIQEPIITVRNGRFVIPIKNEYRSEIKGFIHDISSSGSTVFIEPIAIFDLNNALNQLKNDELYEIEKILQKLSSLFFGITEQMLNNIHLIGLIDFIFAKAKYSHYLDACEPIINDEKLINLIDAWHPLLDKTLAVKNDIPIGKNYRSLIITGPNTGGKTVILKTVGLLTVMAMSGLHITAREGSSIFLFDNIFADIGDEQSIADSLSTFSSHITNIAHILKKSTTNSLVLLDELGSGTDPIEGSSLAISILEKLNASQTLTLCTTHYPEIKHFALVTDAFENASVAFDIETLSPTYQLLVGVPGTSNAFAISRKLGISEEIIQRAKSLIDKENITIEELLTHIYEDKRSIEIEKEKILNNSNKIEQLKNTLEKNASDIKQQEKQIIEKAKIEARNILLSAKEDANTIIRNIEKSGDNKQANQFRNELNSKIENLQSISSQEKTTIEKPLSKENLKINTKVYIPSLHQIGTIISIGKNDKIQVQLPLGKMFFSLSDLSIISDKSIDTHTQQKQEKYKPHPSSNKHHFSVKSISSEIHVLGQTVEEACVSIDKYLDDCYLNGLQTIRIVHGKGTGALRKGIHQFLKTHPHVENFRLGSFGEGETGVTIVTLK